jgi:hypothetical protein
MSDGDWPTGILPVWSQIWMEDLDGDLDLRSWGQDDNKKVSISW